MKQIQITPAELRTQAAELNSLRAEYESLFSNLNSVLNRTNDAWSENLSHNFVGKISSTQKSCSSILEALQWGSTAATKSAESFETVDNTLANGLNESAASDGGSSAGGSNGGGFRGGRIKQGETAPRQQWRRFPRRGVYWRYQGFLVGQDQGKKSTHWQGENLHRCGKCCGLDQGCGLYSRQ